MNKRGGGVKDISIRQLDIPKSMDREYSVDMQVNVCDSMGANTINTLCEELKQIV
jgi:hydroxymethylglutaryl-CoA reductase